MTNERPPIRIGTAERNAAMKALDEHLEAGRLEVDEYGERSARASVATTAPELAALFDDLPAPHPVLPGIAGPVPCRPSRRRPRPARREPSGLQVWGPRLMAVTPFLALGLFLAHQDLGGVPAHPGHRGAARVASSGAADPTAR